MTVACGEIQVMLSCPSEQHGGESSEGSQSMLHSDKKAQTTLFAQRALQEQRRLKPPDTIIACPRCQSLNTKFCYYNNYSLTQPRHFCKNCRRYWTAGGTLRNVPVGGGCRKNKRAKRNNELSSVLSSGESVSRNDGTGSALHPPFNPGNASTSANYYDHPYEDAAKIAVARVQQAVRAGPSGVSQSMEGISSNGHVSPFHVSHGSHSAGMSHSAQSSFEAPVVPSIISLGSYYQPQVKPEVAVLANGDLSAIFESQSYRAAAAAAAAQGGVSALGEGGITYNIDMEALNNMDPGHVDVQWRLHQHVQQQQAAAAAQKQQQQAIWGEEDQGHREARQPLHNAAADEKGLMESLRQAKGKSAIPVSPSSGHEQAAEGPEVSRPLSGVPAWQQGPPESMQSLEQQDSAFWSNQSWAPLDMHALNPPANNQIL